MEGANEYLSGYWPRFNAAFGVEAAGEGTAFVPLPEVGLDDIPCLRETRTVGNDNCASYRGRRLRIEPQPHRIHYVRAKVRVHEYEDGSLAVFHETLRLGRYDREGCPPGALNGAKGASS